MNQIHKHTLWLFLILVNIMSNNSIAQNNPVVDPLLIKKCNEFEITGNGGSLEWNKAEWSALTMLDKGGREYSSQFKIMYSDLGIYILFYGEDDRITTK